MAMANMDPIFFLMTEDTMLRHAMQATAQGAARQRQAEREEQAALIANKVWESF